MLQISAKFYFANFAKLLLSMLFAPELGKNMIMHSVLSMINDYLPKCLRDILHFCIWYIPVEVVICFLCCLVTSATIDKEVFQKHLSIVLRKKSLNFDKYSSRFVPYEKYKYCNSCDNN